WYVHVDLAGCVVRWRCVCRSLARNKAGVWFEAVGQRGSADACGINTAETFGFVGYPEVVPQEQETTGASDAGRAQYSSGCGEAAMIVWYQRRAGTGRAVHDSRFGRGCAGKVGGDELEQPGSAGTNQRSGNFRKRSFNCLVVRDQDIPGCGINSET